MDSPTASAVGGSVDIVTKIPTEDLRRDLPADGRQLQLPARLRRDRHRRSRPLGHPGLSLGELRPLCEVRGPRRWKCAKASTSASISPLKGQRLRQPLAAPTCSSTTISTTPRRRPSSTRPPSASARTTSTSTPSGAAMPSAINGHADTPPMGAGPLINKGSTPGFNQGNDPFGDGLGRQLLGAAPQSGDLRHQIRGASHFTLTDKLSFTFDPSLVLLHPGQRRRRDGSPPAESDPRLKGNNLTRPRAST